MHLSIQRLIEQIHNGPLYGYFIENGGPCVATELMKVSGASRTIKSLLVPYSKDSSEAFKTRKYRTVSLAYIRDVLEFYSNRDANLAYASSFQLENNCHGYVGLWRKGNFEYYHLSVHDSSLTRPEKIDLLNETCIKLLHGQVVKDCCIDGVWNSDLSPSLDRTLQFISESEVFDNLTYIENNEILRLEDLLRKANGRQIVIMKGSFNPVHNGHLKIVEEVKQKYPNAFVCFSISTHNFDKGSVDVSNLKWRIDCINRLGYGVLVYNRPLFEDLIKVLRSKSKEVNVRDVIFPIGGDTWTRLRACYESDKDIEALQSKFLVFARGEQLDCSFIPNVDLVRNFGMNISSTEIRKNPNQHLNDVPKEIQSCLIQKQA